MHLEHLLIFIATASATAIVASLLVRWRDRIGLLDLPNERSSHAYPRPRTGGGAAVLGIACGLALSHSMGLPWGDGTHAIIPFAVAFFLLGATDDRWKINERVRLLAQALLACALACKGLRIMTLSFSGNSDLPLAISWGLSIFWIVGFVNLFNFMDGIDGIATVNATLIGLFLHLLTGGILPLLLSASALGFFFFNRHPAKLFLGDNGSYLFGFLIAAESARGTTGPSRTPFLVLAIISGAFIADTSLTLLRRIVRNEDWLRAHRSHYYQKLTGLGWSHNAVTSLYGMLTFILGVAGVCSMSLHPRGKTALIMGCCMALMLTFWRLHRLDERR